MIEFRISAPGKVILHGEHAVVYGRTALAASLDLRTTIAFAELPKSDSKDVIKIEFPNIDLHLDLPLQLFLDHFYGGNFHYKVGENNDSLLHEQVEHFITLLDSSCGIRVQTHQQKLSVHALLYLLLYIGHEERIDVKSFHVNLTTQLTINAGLGSSASFAVCLAACFLHWSRLQKAAAGPFDKDDLDEISKYALSCERIMHGSPSGVDNSVCTYGSIIEFRRGEPVNVLPEMPSMKILLVDSKISRNTKDQVKRLTDMRRLYPAIVDPVLDSINALSRTALEVIGRIRDNSDDDVALLEEYKKLLTLVNMNQGLLSTLDMSHLKLDVICSIARASGFAGKLTGAGGGGYAYILLLPHTTTERIASLSEQLIAENFSVTTTSLGCGGVKIE